MRGKRLFALASMIGFTGALTSSAGQRVDDHRVQRLLDRAVVIDLHSDTTQRILEEGIDLAKRYDDGQVDIPRMREGGVTAMFFATNPNSRRLTPLESIRRALEEIDAVRLEVARHPADLVLATTADEIERAKHQGKIAILIGIEGGHVIDSSTAVLRSLYELGARYMTLTHFTHTPWADSSGEPPRSHGLTDEGKAIVREMNRLGMLVDISHVSDETFFDALEASEAPVIASHSSARKFSEHPRNLSDEMLAALAKNGGVVHINYYNPYLDEDYRLRSTEARDLDDRAAAVAADNADDPKRLAVEIRKVNAERIARFGRVSFDRLLDHFDHAVRVAGIDHVGLGSDFDGVGDLLPEGMEDVSKIPNLVRGLMERGYSDEDIEKVLGQNTLRAMREVEATARAKQR
ncbi:MAG TPA: dipeptidase [Vicinamibacteria bacterium]|nr:dipeptidase [Vicinamibacteria bacterium]